MMVKIKNKKSAFIIFCMAVLFLSIWGGASAIAQKATDLSSEKIITDGTLSLIKYKKTLENNRHPDPNAPFSADRIPSLFFTYWQHQAIMDAKNSRGTARPPTQSELDAASRGESFDPEPGDREIVLGGIVFSGEKEWTIWINGKRVSPNAIPKEVLDLKVFEDYIEVKWLDEYTGQVFPLRLRAHERFNMDMRIFLPG